MELVRNSSDEKVMRKKGVAARPFMLKDYLMDDMSSCSSNGFKSYPRRQCCTTVRFLTDIDLKSRDRPKIRSKKRPAAASTAMSALQRASVAVFNAVKILPFTSVRSASPVATDKSSGKGVLSRSFSRKLLKRSFWKKNGKDEPDRRIRLFGELLGQTRERASDESTQHSIATTTITASRLSTSTTSSNSRSNSNSYSIGDIDFSPGGEGKSEDLLAEKKVNKRVGVTVSHESTEAATTPCSGQNPEVWQNQEGKEQFSPVSVLDCPFEDEEEEEDSSSQFKRSLACVEGTKKKLMQKLKRFERVAVLDPLDLEKRIALSEHCICTSISTNKKVKANEEERKTEQELEALLKRVKATSCKFVADNLVLDFFRERLVEDNGLCEHELLTAARDWVNGNPGELVVGWEVQEGREMYVREMEKGGRWRVTQDEVAVGLDGEIWSYLLNDLLLDLL